MALKTKSRENKKTKKPDFSIASLKSKKVSVLLPSSLCELWMMLNPNTFLDK